MLRPLVDSLYDSSRGSTDLINQAQNELSLLLAVLRTAETQLSFSSHHASPEIQKTLQSCHHALLDLQKLQGIEGGVGPQGQISDIRARFSDLIFELSVMNANMMISSQNNVNRILRDFTEDIKSGKREAKVISSALDDTSSDSDRESAWGKLQQELQDAGIATELSSQDRDIIMSTFRKAVDQEDLLKNITSTPEVDEPINRLRSPAGPLAEPQALSQENGQSDKEVVTEKEENFPIPVAFEIQDTDDTSKHAWATITSPVDDFPIPVWTEPGLQSGDTDKQVVSVWQPDTLPIPVETNNRHNRTGNRTSISSSSASRSQPPAPTLSRGKRPSLMSRMKFKLTKSHDFIALIQMGGLYSIRCALEKGANVNTTNEENQTALMVAISFRHEDVVSLLLEWGAKTEKIGTHGETALGTAALRGLDDIAQRLLLHGTDPDSAKNVGKTALSQAAICGSLSMTRLLLDWGADPNAVSSNGATALACAADNGRIQTARLLLDRGAQVDKCGYPRRTPLFKAVQRGNIEMAELLLSSGADPNCQDSHKHSPMALAISLDRVEMVGIFCQHGSEFGANPIDATRISPPPARTSGGKSSAAYQYY
ncbi:hypothetical protein N7448_002917 [Penicillium atrosanguineum]|uniref:transcriptional regulator family: C2H2 zinc finger n=1 Tax=Penicillium atrosanguineum TaxID=1132637 RepID=UPI00238F68FB|nr:transcriptional regulator family: C2H2 zinc finger [Penicillium atrosanguineum]KAJ5139509.1 hypothetical protein N7448_002917 [Penicillium atrosanguineum]KAJ5309429.1 transcriptional regulator family: C2H2 zinc finger [Penicillium atrosanguineum]